MLYITLILIASGLFLIIYSIFIDLPKKSKTSGLESLAKDDGSDTASFYEAEPETNKDFTDFEAKTNAPKDYADDELDIFEEVDFNDTASFSYEEEKEEPQQELEIFEDIETDIDDNIDNKTDEEVAIPILSKEGKNTAVLYEDSSNIFDYDNNKSIIDSTLKEYSKIKRIGKGRVEIKNNGVNFNIEKKFYRFDLHQVEKIISGKNYFCLFMKKNNIARLFLFNEDTPLGFEVERILKNYSRENK